MTYLHTDMHRCLIDLGKYLGRVVSDWSNMSWHHHHRDRDPIYITGPSRLCSSFSIGYLKEEEAEVSSKLLSLYIDRKYKAVFSGRLNFQLQGS